MSLSIPPNQPPPTPVPTGSAEGPSAHDHGNVMKAIRYASLFFLATSPRTVLTRRERQEFDALTAASRSAGMPAAHAWMMADPGNLASLVARETVNEAGGAQGAFADHLRAAPEAERERFRLLAVTLFGEDSTTLALHGGANEMDPAHWEHRVATWLSVPKLVTLLGLTVKETRGTLTPIEKVALDALKKNAQGRWDASSSDASVLLERMGKDLMPGEELVEVGKPTDTENPDRLQEMLESPRFRDPNNVELALFIAVARATFGADRSTEAMG